MSSTKPKLIINLICPSLPSKARLLVSPEQRLDFAAISRAFGLDPSSIKLNGHFIAQGSDLVACSVTWNSLVSFFDFKGLPSGQNDNSRIVVSGKLSKVGEKRRGSDDGVEAIGCGSEDVEGGQVVNNSKKMKITDPGCEMIKYNGICSKRKQILEDVRLLKKLKINDNNSDNKGRGRELCGSFSNMKSQFRCSYPTGRLKRMREDEAV